MMSDNCKGYRIEQSIFLWVTDDGLLGEIESIYPEVVDKAPCRYSSQMKRTSGFPMLDIDPDGIQAVIQHHDSGFTIWLSKDKTIDLEIQSDGNVSFLVAGNQLVGIKAKQAKIVE